MDKKILEVYDEIKKNNPPNNDYDFLIRMIPAIIGYDEKSIVKFCYNLCESCNIHPVSQKISEVFKI